MTSRLVDINIDINKPRLFQNANQTCNWRLLGGTIQILLSYAASRVIFVTDLTVLSCSADGLIPIMKYSSAQSWPFQGRDNETSITPVPSLKMLWIIHCRNLTLKFNFHDQIAEWIFSNFQKLMCIKPGVVVNILELIWR